MSSLTYSLAAVIILLAANAFFVAAEFALVKVRGYQLDQAVGQHRRAAVLSARMHANLDAYLAACQLGITMASLGLGWVGEPAVAALLEPLLSKVGVTGPALHTIAFIIGFLIFSSLHIVVGEQVPKTYAIRKPTPVTLALSYPLHWFYLLVFPLNWLLDRANAGILRLLGVRGGPHHEIISEDEISAIVDDSEAHGELEQKTAEIIRKAFLFDDQTVREIMVPWVNVDKLRLTSDAETNKKIVISTQHSRFPVLDGKGNVVGVLATKDLTTAFIAEEQDVWASLSERLRSPMVVPPTLLISSLLERMRSTRTHMAIAVDEHGTYIGIVTLEDMLEEIVGEIEDEWDIDEIVAPIEAIESGWRANGQLPLAVLEETVGINIERHSQIGTLGGFVMQLLERLPKEGDAVDSGGFRFYVARMDGRQVQTVLISPSGTRRGKTIVNPGKGSIVMTSQDPTFLRSFVIDKKGRGQKIDAEEVQQWSPEQGMLWVHLDVSDPHASRWLTKEARLPAIVVDTLLAGETRPRSSVSDEGMLAVLRGVNMNPGADPEDMVSVRIWIDGHRIISSRRRRLLSIDDICEALHAGKGPTTPGDFLVMLIERLADRIGGFVDSIEDRMDEAEDEISKGKAPGFRQRLSALRRQIAEVRRFLAPQRDALDRLTRQSSAWLSEAEAHNLRQEADRITRFLEDLDLARERAVVLQEELLSLIAQEQNARMYVLSVVAAIFLPLTFVTGLLGMNVGGLPGLESPVGFTWSIVVMIFAGAGLLLFFRWKKWL